MPRFFSSSSCFLLRSTQSSHVALFSSSSIACRVRRRSQAFKNRLKAGGSKAQPANVRLPRAAPAPGAAVTPNIPAPPPAWFGVPVSVPPAQPCRPPLCPLVFLPASGSKRARLPWWRARRPPSLHRAREGGLVPGCLASAVPPLLAEDHNSNLVPNVTHVLSPRAALPKGIRHEGPRVGRSHERDVSPVARDLVLVAGAVEQGDHKDRPPGQRCQTQHRLHLINTP
mmetsp:Transcript_36271/g.89348  ORF Transcript_36271/g.89348 Transcript_36271/m.89348 type:complete len:227 (-) Transcript_36271:371-1051(-)